MFSFRRAALTWNDVRVGIFVVVGIIITLAGILFLQPGKRLGSRFRVRSIYSTVGGLTQGAPVMMSGVQVGTVTNIRVIRNPSEIPSNQELLKELKLMKTELDQINSSTSHGRQMYKKLESKYVRMQSELKRVSVLMEISTAEKDLVGAASVALIKNQGLVGEKYVDLSTSGPDAGKLTPVTDSTGVAAVEVPGQEPFDIASILQNASGAASSLEDVMSEIDTDITQGKGTLGKLIKDPSVHDHLNATLKEMSRATKYSGDLMQSIKDGKGTIGKLFTDSGLFDSANNMLKSIDKGEGTLGKLIHDPAVYNEVNGAMKNMNAALVKVNEGRGTIHKLLDDPSLYRNANALMVSTGDLISSANHGKGTFGKFATDDALYTNTNKAMAGIAEATDRMNKGQGTLGMLLQDKKVYENLTVFSDEMVKFIKEFRQNPKKYLTLQLNVIKLF